MTILGIILILAGAVIGGAVAGIDGAVVGGLAGFAFGIMTKK